MEQLQDDIRTALWTLGKPKLTKVCQHLKCREPTVVGFKGQPRHALIRLAESALDEIEEAEESEVFLLFV